MWAIVKGEEVGDRNMISPVSQFSTEIQFISTLSEIDKAAPSEGVISHAFNMFSL